MLQPAPRHQPSDHSSVDMQASMDAAGPISTPIVAALERAWADIRARHPHVPPAVIVLGAGSIGARGALRLGHFAAMRWHIGRVHDQEDEAAEQLAEVFVGGEGLRRGPIDVFGTLLHEAAHALAHVRRIRDTSRQGRWHNTRFKALAEELGIQVTKDPRIGWSPTTLPEITRQTYATTIAALGAALRLYRSAELTSGTNKPTNPPACVCDCGRRIRVAPSVLAAGPITCGICDSHFTPEPD